MLDYIGLHVIFLHNEACLLYFTFVIFWSCSCTYTIELIFYWNTNVAIVMYRYMYITSVCIIWCFILNASIKKQKNVYAWYLFSMEKIDRDHHDWWWILDLSNVNIWSAMIIAIEDNSVFHCKCAFHCQVCHQI